METWQRMSTVMLAAASDNPTVRAAYRRLELAVHLVHSECVATQRSTARARTALTGFHAVLTGVQRSRRGDLIALANLIDVTAAD